MNTSRRLTWLILAIAALAAIAAGWPLIFSDGSGPAEHLSVRGETVLLYGYGPYRHMPADVAVQGLAQDLVTLLLAIPVLIGSWWLTRSGSRAAYLVLTGAVGYLFVQYFMYLAMATYNELFLLWVALVMLTSQALVRLLIAGPSIVESVAVRTATRRYVGIFLVINATLIALLWLNSIVPPLISGTLYPAGLAHFTTMIVQGFDLALFLPPSVLAGYYYLFRHRPGDLLAPVYAVFLSLQMTALLAKIVWMNSIGVSAGPALVIIPLLLMGALAAAFLALRPHMGTSG